MPPEVSIVIPCYEEEGSIPELLSALDETVATLAEGGRTTEVIVIDDGSRDGSFELLSEGGRTRPWLRTIRLRRNYGQTAAMSAGFDAARGTYIVPMDADLQNDPSDIPAMLAESERGHDVVCGWRKHRKDRWLHRRLPSRIANWIIGRVSGLRLHDYGCTLKVFRAEYIKGVRLYGEMHRFMPIYARWEGARITEMPVKHHPRRHGVSKYGLERGIKVILDLITLKLLGDYSTKPLYMFGRPGLLLCLLGTLCAAFAGIEKWTIGTWVHKNPVALLAVMLFIVGVQLIGLGLLAELQVRTYHESQAKPTYRIREQVNEPCAESQASSLQIEVPSMSKRSAP